MVHSQHTKMLGNKVLVSETGQQVRPPGTATPMTLHTQHCSSLTSGRTWWARVIMVMLCLAWAVAVDVVGLAPALARSGCVQATRGRHRDSMSDNLTVTRSYLPFNME